MEQNPPTLIQKIEAILFYKAEPISEKELAKTLAMTEEEIRAGIEELSKTLSTRGIRLVRHDKTALLTTAPELSGLIENMIKEERESTLGRAGIETLSIIAYKGTVSKKEIEYIRGVNSDYAIRSLLLRGLIEKKGSETDERIVVYTITSDTLRYLGLTHISELPEYERVKRELDIKPEMEEGIQEDDSQE